MKKFFPKLKTYIEQFLIDLKINDSRKEILNQLSVYLAQKKMLNNNINLIFICTHNSRRSHFAQIWATIAAAWYEIENIHCFSGGTEESAFNPRAVAALLRAGCYIENMDNTAEKNPRYRLIFADDAPEIITFSKVYTHRTNPSENFAAVMVCSHADENCPFIPGAEKRFSIPYEDPKNFDNTTLESLKYDETCKEIAMEMFYVFKNISYYLNKIKA